jgi:hypothetical protein
VTRRKLGILDYVFLLRRGLRFLVVSLGLLISLSCSRGEKTADSSVKESAKGTAVKLPPRAMSLSSVLKAVESAGYAPVIEVEFEKDHWEVKAYRNGQLLQLSVGLLAGDILPNPPPTLERPLSVIVKGLEDQGYGPILDVERGAGRSEGPTAWEIEAYKGNSEVSISVESNSGKITTK